MSGDYGIGDDQALLADLEAKLTPRYGIRARAVAEAQLGGYDYDQTTKNPRTPADAERIRRGPLRSGSAPLEAPEPLDPFARDLYRAVGAPLR